MESTSVESFQPDWSFAHLFVSCPTANSEMIHCFQQKADNQMFQTWPTTCDILEETKATNTM